MDNNKFITKHDKCGIKPAFFLGASVFLFGFPGGFLCGFFSWGH